MASTTHNQVRNSSGSSLSTPVQNELSSQGSRVRPAEDRHGFQHIDWRTAAEIKVLFRGLPLKATTKDVWDNFAKEGDLSSIDLYTDPDGRRNGRGCLRFRFFTLSTAALDLTNMLKSTSRALFLADESRQLYVQTGGSAAPHNKIAP